ncbi:MAG: HAD-IA family hydrolase [Cyanobacteriota bacterium]|nr:HAD-IA family hydrolase [Cyanobacteriota bacterium]
MTPPPRALLLDAMGTLITLRESVGVSYATVANRHGLQIDPLCIDRVFPELIRQAPPLAFPGVAEADLRRAEINWWSDRISAAMTTAPLPAGLAEDLFEHFADPAQWRLFPEVPTCLERWRKRGLRLAIVSNFDSRLPVLLEGLGIDQLFDSVVVSSSAGAAKPDPKPFRLALEALGIEAQDAWHVGDSAEDVSGAAAAGVRCLLVQRP